MLLLNGFYGKPQLIAESFAGVPCIGRLKFFGMRDFLLKLLRSQIAAVSVCQRQPVLVNVIAVCALDLGYSVAAAGHKRHHVYPEDILHAASGNGAAVFLCQCVKTVYLRSGGGPRINCLLAGGYNINPARNAFFHMFIDIVYEAEQRNNGRIRIAFAENLVGIV